jgi:hypothetical protein
MTLLLLCALLQMYGDELLDLNIVRSSGDENLRVISTDKLHQNHCVLSHLRQSLLINFHSFNCSKRRRIGKKMLTIRTDEGKWEEKQRWRLTEEKVEIEGKYSNSLSFVLSLYQKHCQIVLSCAFPVRCFRCCLKLSVTKKEKKKGSKPYIFLFLIASLPSLLRLLRICRAALWRRLSRCQ